MREKGLDKVKDYITIKLVENSYGGKTGIISLHKDGADRLTKVSHIRVGLSNCRLQEKINVSKCWKYGHMVNTCTNEEVDTTNRCYRCGTEGHRRAECPNERKHCITCGQDGHASGTTMCKIFRSALSAERQKWNDGVK
ncbi:hypothetical protein RI129_011932 [Pyrocoelia pectoralis]|uniref:CCHC-type domain-containing protein n=1 Tax=Pyrocoelia pectoralis TaxID=417401 RepID=A0AAN7Z880_9COLE